MIAFRRAARHCAIPQARGGTRPSSATTQVFLCLVGIIWVTGCASALPVSGLRPEYPEARQKFVEVDSPQPTLRWEAFPRPQDRAADIEGVLGRIREVTYDLQIWRADESPVQSVGGQQLTDYPSELVYFRRSLPVPWHRVEEPLEPSTKYFWAIRARFELDGLPRVTQWGVAAPNVSDPRVVWGPLVPSPFHYRFKTP
jgi:hypothetical protein